MSTTLQSPFYSPPSTENFGVIPSTRGHEHKIPNCNLIASIILVNYNSWSDLERCLISLEINLVEDTEVIVVDNGSTDESPQCIEKNFPNVRWVRSSLNVGFGGGCNLGANHANGRTLVFLNPDTVVTSGWLTPLLNTLETRPEIGMATSRILLMSNPDRINTCGNNIHISGVAMCRGMGKPVDTICKEKTEDVSAISGAAFAIRKDLFQAIGGFDETFFLYMEDTDLSLRVRLAGYRIVCRHDSTVYHDYTLRFGPKKTFFQERNRYLMLLKCFRWSTLAILMPVLILTEINTWGFILLRDRKNMKNKPLAYNWILANWKQIKEKRAKTQESRRGVKDRDLLNLAITRIDYDQAYSGWIVKLAALVFDPLFGIMGRLLMGIWW
jgi:hypothetical protein